MVYLWFSLLPADQFDLIFRPGLSYISNNVGIFAIAPDLKRNLVSFHGSDPALPVLVSFYFSILHFLFSGSCK